jgi:orotidine-5'-phosphate decarboxylase
MSFASRLLKAIAEKNAPCVVGLDPNLKLFPKSFQSQNQITEFCKNIIDVVCDLVPAVKPQSAYFEQWGAKGIESLEEVLCYAKTKGLITILDVKRGDIAATSEAYARAYLERGAALEADAITISPYLGSDSLTPFIDIARANSKGLFVLTRTSNPGAKLFQDLVVDGKPLFMKVAEYLNELRGVDDSGYSDIGAVVGATWPEELKTLRTAMPHTIFLVPGYGAQGGDLASLKDAFDSQGKGAIINSSRGITFPKYAEGADHFAEVRKAAVRFVEEIRSIAKASSQNHP